MSQKRSCLLCPGAVPTKATGLLSFLQVSCPWAYSRWQSVWILKQLIKESRMTPHAVAVAAGIDSSNLYRLLDGERRRPSNETLTRLAGVLGVGVDELTCRHPAVGPLGR
jgi:Helix-turn-helix domain